MYRAPASNKLRLLVALDEARGYLPPYPHNPPTKSPLCTLLAQGRAQGIGVLVGTQNPNDIDYKALSNVGTWFLGKLRARDCVRDLEAELLARNVDLDLLLNIPQRTFLVLKKDGSSTTTVIRWTYSYLRGPINLDELAQLGQVPAPRNQVREAAVSSGGMLNLSFVLTNQESRPTPVKFRYSTDDGVTWSDATVNGLRKPLASSPIGVAHTCVWDTESDLGRVEAVVLLNMLTDGAPSTVISKVSINNTNLPKRGLLARIFG